MKTPLEAMPGAALLLLSLPAIHCSSPPEINVRELEPAVDHNHCTTRQFQHMVFHHSGVWFVFYSDGADFRYQTSADRGATWQPAPEPVAPAPNGSTGFDVLKAGDLVYLSYSIYPLGRYDVNAPYAQDPARRGEYTAEGRVKKGRITGRAIEWIEELDPGFKIDYSNIELDSAGYIWVFTREGQQGTAHRGLRPGDLAGWTPPMRSIPVSGRHAQDAAALDHGKLYAASVLTTGGKLYGNLYDGERWGESPTLIAGDLTTVAGDDRRLALEFDPSRRRLHLIYVDAAGILRYRSLDAPYLDSNWQPPLPEPGLNLAANVFTAALTLDPTGDLIVTYGLERHLGQDRRVRTGELYARRLRDAKWAGDPILVSQPATIYNWYPNVPRRAGPELCVLYSRSVNPNHLGQPLAVMASVLHLPPAF